MQNGIFLFTTLITNIVRNTRLISKFTHRVHKISICPKFTTPQFLFHFRMFPKNFSCCDTFQHRDDLGCTHLGNRLNQKMDMILIRANLQKMNLVSFFNFQTNRLQCLINCFAEHYFTIFGRAYKMIQQYRYIVRFMYVFAFTHTYKVKIFTPQAAGN